MRPYRILIVDDQPENLQTIVHYFEKLDSPYEVFQSTTGTRAFDIACLEQPDLVISDWDMPGLSGIDLIRKLKRDPVTADIPVIMCTGVMVSSENLQAALSAGAMDYIRKPVDPIELIARTRTMVQMSDMIKQIKEQNHALRHTNAVMEKISRTDPLTQLSNRRDLDDRLQQESAKASRQGGVFSVIICDIDRFKQFNDQHGHECGDYVLVEVAGLLQENTRAYDMVGRWGGEEFLIILPDTDQAGGRDLAEKIRKIIEARTFRFNQLDLKVTLTFGVCAFQGDRNVDTCLSRADEALYRGKAAGRNRVEVA